MHAFYLLSVWLHLLAAMIWIGGMVFLAMALVPVIRRLKDQEVATTLIHETGMRFRWVGWGCLGLLLVSGTVNLAYRGFGWTDVWSGRIVQGPLGQVLGFKLLLVAVILLISALHDFLIGPRATALGQADPTSLEARRLRRQASWLGRLNLLLALIVVALGVMLVRGLP
ncbi:MAG: DUF4149 domain-containing protein [candidate division NC10 bacterium]|nr:DUF4149 domain-containing protein [candidate division NC10 bacterium]